MVFDQIVIGSVYILPENFPIYQIIKAPANSFKMMYREPWVARGNLDSTGNMVEIEPKFALKLGFGSIPQVLPHATQVSERRPGLMIHNFEAIDACFDNMVNLTIFWQNIGRSCGVLVK